MKRNAKRRPAKLCQQGPARALIEQSPHRIVGAFRSNGSSDDPIEWESDLERRAITLLLSCSDVTELKSQPIKCDYECDGRIHTYVPDLAVLVHGVWRYIEVKALRYLMRPDQLDKYLAVATAFQRRGYEYAFITDDQLPDCRVRNAERLNRFQRVQRPSDKIVASVHALLKGGPSRLRKIVNELRSPAALADTYTLIAHRDLCIDWDQPLNRGALVSRPGLPFEELTYERVRTSGRFVDLLATMALGRRPPDQRCRTAQSARRRPLSGPSPFGGVGGLDFIRTHSTFSSADTRPASAGNATTASNDEADPDGDRKQAKARC